MLEVDVELALDHLLGGGDDGLADARIELAECDVGLGRGALDHAQGAHYGGRLLLPADPEVLQTPLGLRRPVAVGRNLDRPEGVGLGPGGGHGWSSRAATARV